MSLIVDIQKNLGSFHLSAAFETAGGVTALLGASGAGKSMTLKCIAGIERPDSGRIELDGKTLFDSKKRIDLPPQRRRVGYLFQSYALFPNMTVRQNILCGLRAEHDGAARQRALAEAIALLRLDGLEQLRPAQLSGGQQQRTALARILVSKPGLLLLDEPFSALDSHLREALQIELKGILSRCESPSLLVTHSRDEAYRLSSSIALLDNGRMLAPRPAAELFSDPGSVVAARLTGCKNISAAMKTGEHMLFAQDWGIHLQTAQPLRDGLCAVGVQAHAFRADEAYNRFPVLPGSPVEEPFALAIPFRFLAQPAASDALWQRVAKIPGAQNAPATLGIAPKDVLPLYGA